MREAVVHAVPVSRHPNDETIDGPLMCRKCTKRETGEMSGNAPIAVNQAVQRRVKNGGPSETLRTSLAPQGAPGSGRRLGAASIRAVEEQSPQITGESGAVKTVGVPQGGTKSEPATQVTGKGRLGGEKKEGVEKDDQGHQNRERKEDRKRQTRGVKRAGQKESWRSGRRAPKKTDT